MDLELEITVFWWFYYSPEERAVPVCTADDTERHTPTTVVTLTHTLYRYTKKTWCGSGATQFKNNILI